MKKPEFPKDRDERVFIDPVKVERIAVICMIVFYIIIFIIAYIL